jgi:hypothetical protein
MNRFLREDLIRFTSNEITKYGISLLKEPPEDRQVQPNINIEFIIGTLEDLNIRLKALDDDDDTTLLSQLLDYIEYKLKEQMALYYDNKYKNKGLMKLYIKHLMKLRLGINIDSI